MAALFVFDLSRALFSPPSRRAICPAVELASRWAFFDAPRQGGRRKAAWWR
jgi:hypothetical protein